MLVWVSGLTVVRPPLARLEVKVLNVRHHIWGSRTASQAWSHLNDPKSRTPVLFSSVRCTAMARSFFFRKIVFAGESGRRIKSGTAYADVTAPRIRKMSCQCATLVALIWPMPQEITPPRVAATQLPKNQPNCLMWSAELRSRLRLLTVVAVPAVYKRDR